VAFVVDKAVLKQVFCPNTSVSPANHHSTNFSIIIITRGWYNRPIGGRSAEWVQMDSTLPTLPIKKKTSKIRRPVGRFRKKTVQTDTRRYQEQRKKLGRKTLLQISTDII
jgi:hypothetical protein